jgi:UDP-2,3-diacylglucosamine pyrophosphatase LpxH
MLVLASDLHLTDGSSGTTINASAFGEFANSVTQMVEKAQAKRLEIVFLGDVIDVIRSAVWLGTSIRPWSGKDESDQGKGLKDYAIQITNDICKRPANAACTEQLARLKTSMSAKGVPVTISYIVGNHDWLVNRYPETRQLAKDFLLLDGDTVQDGLPDQGHWEEYGVFARHGDIYDDFNFDGNRDASSLGDAIVIDLLNKFPRAVAQELGSAVTPEFISLLCEIDNVRPLLDTPLWIVAACEEVHDAVLAERVHAVWDKIVDEFLSNKFVLQHDRLFELTDPFDKLRFALRLSERLPLGTLARVLENPLLTAFQGQSTLIDRASQEKVFQEGQTDFVVYGHTHEFGIWPIGYFIKNPRTQNTMPLRQSYLNTGTWRKVFEHGGGARFSGWNVMTFINFYLDDERDDYLFEVWNGSLA